MSLTFISAGAGSGKTYTLTHLLRERLDTGGVRPAGVIATTFTRKAAAELRERVRSHLLESGRFALANAMGQAHIGTINSVCGKLLERFAFEAGLPPKLQVIEDADARRLVREAIDAALTGEEVAALSALAERLGIEDWQEALATLVAQTRSNDIDPARLADFAEQNARDLLAHFPKVTHSTLEAELLAAIQHSVSVMKATAPNSKVKLTQETIALLEQFQRNVQHGRTTWADWVKLSKQEPEKKLAPLLEPVHELALRHAEHPQLQADLRDYLDGIFQACARTLDCYRERKLQLAVMDFVDQEHLLLTLLDHPDVSAVLKDELDLLLVDEFQDTSPIQLALFLKLSALARETCWVGDVKQAIYGFRGSDSALMTSIVGALPQLGGNKTVLRDSWRSRPALVNLVNQTFAPAFAASLPAADVALNAQRPANDAPAFAEWRLAGKNDTQRRAALAAGVRRLIDGSGLTVPDGKDDAALRPLAWRDVAILCGSNKTVVNLAGSLRQAGIPVATSQPGLLRTPEATLALACLRRLNDPQDTVATAEILSLAGSEAPEDWLADRLNHVGRGGTLHEWREKDGSPHPWMVQIASLRSERLLLSPREALARVIARCDIPRRVLAWRQDPAVAQTRLANLEALLELAARYEECCVGSRRAATIAGLLRWLSEQAEEGEDALAESGLNAVRISTHHSAKGLEWPVVILCDLDRDIQDRLWDISAVSLDGVDAHDPLKDRFIRYWPWPFGKQAKGIPVADQIDASPDGRAFRATAEAEARRLLYVSMTRPRELLIFARNEKDSGSGWQASLGAPWLDSSSATDADGLTLPSGDTVAAMFWQLEAPAELPEAAAPGVPVHWFPEPVLRARLPLYAAPSAAGSAPAGLLEQVTVGERVAVEATTDWGILGTAVHACLGASFSCGAAPTQFGKAEIARQLGLFRMEELIPAEALHRQILAFHAWLKQRWPNHRALAETPALALRPDGQRLKGRIDLLLETPEGYILIDHKSSPLGPDKWPELASKHSGQLAAYAEAITQITGKPVLEQWLFLPVAGAALRLEI